MRSKLVIVFLGALLGTVANIRSAPTVASIGSPEIEARLDLAGTNRTELRKAIEAVTPDQKAALLFLIQNMPESDLRSLSASFLLKDLKMAYRALEQAPWREKVSQALFFNDVLPYACMNEQRENWRENLRATCLPMIEGAESPGQAAQLLNQKLFGQLHVRYNTSRHRPDQSPSETIATGKATCTGLSILLVDACRAVGIPARVAGTPMWTNLRGNHTWVEIWDNGWHFAGAAEPDPAGLDHGWFVNDAAKARKDEPEHAIYATSFARTGVHFPLVWARSDHTVNAVNVTDRYALNETAEATNSVILDIKVVDTSGRREAATVTVNGISESNFACSALSRDESADLNNFASFKLPPGRQYRVTAMLGSSQAQATVRTVESGEQLVTLVLPQSPAPSLVPSVMPVTRPLSAKQTDALMRALKSYFAAPPERQTKWKFSSRLDKMLRENEPAVRGMAWEAYRTGADHSNLRSDFEAKRVTFKTYTSPYTVKQVGQRPPNGWPLFIALHGGGGVPKEVNDSQWRHMQIYYKDHPEVGGYLYLALRAPNDTWNGFYDDYVYPLIDNLILQFRLFGDINPDKVFIMGYSHGGYGAYAIGPKMPDRFAAIHASAAAATDGESVPDTLRSTPFTAMVGEKDTMYGRYERNLRFKDEIEKLRGARNDIYPVTVTVIKGNGHTGLPDRDLIPEMYPAVRNPVPTEIDWLMTDSVVKDFFWLQVPRPGKQQQIQATLANNHLALTVNDHVSNATVFLDGRMIDFRRPVTIELNGSNVTRRLSPHLKTFCQTLEARGDPAYAFSASFSLERNPQGQLQVR